MYETPAGTPTIDAATMAGISFDQSSFVDGVSYRCL